MALPYMPLYIGDYIRDTGQLDAMESGAYLHLLMHMWNHDGMLSASTESMVRIAKVDPRNWPRVWTKIKPLLTEVKGGYVQKRLSAEYEKAQAKSAARAAAGKVGGERRALAAGQNLKPEDERLPRRRQATASRSPKQTASMPEPDKDIGASLPASSAQVQARQAIQNSCGEGVGDAESFADISDRDLESLIARFGLAIVLDVVKSKTAHYRSSPLRSIGALVPEFEAAKLAPTKPEPKPVEPIAYPPGKPGELLRAAVARKGEGWTRSWLVNSATINGEAVYAHGELAETRIRAAIGSDLDALGYAIVVRQA